MNGRRRHAMQEFALLKSQRGFCRCSAIRLTQEWRRLVTMTLVVCCLATLTLHTLLSLTSVPPQACEVPYTHISQEIETKNKILLAAYYRGGSSFFGKLFQSNDDVLYWFEPLRPSHGDFKYHLQPTGNFTEPNNFNSLCPDQSASSQKVDVSILRAVFACDIATVIDISQQIIAYAQMRLYVPTLPLLFDRLGKFNPLPYRIQPGCIAGRCDQASTIAAKTIRLRMRNVRPLLSYDPKIKVIYYSRDPRGIMSSLTKLGEVKENTIEGMCATIEDDYMHYMKLKAEFPDRVKWIRYEDLATKTKKVSESVYEFSTGQNYIPSSVQQWIGKNTNVTREEYNGITGTKRNSTANATEWKTIISEQTKTDIERICTRVLKLLNYKIEK